ncbi:Restriction endonuclease [uncultured archaeon]|nr:Restriction endonuclease [uncultured archaeon]
MNLVEQSIKLVIKTIWMVISGIVKGLQIPELLYCIRRKVKRLFGNKSKYSLRDFEVMTGKQFEHAVQEILETKDFRTRTLPWNDYGADLIAEKEGLRFVIQCKRYSNNVGLDAVQEAYTACRYYGCDKAWVITNSEFTFQAQKMAEKIGVRAMSGKELEKLI